MFSNTAIALTALRWQASPPGPGRPPCRRCTVAFAKPPIRTARHDPSIFGGPTMTHFSTPQDRCFPYVLVCSTLGILVSLASVWIFTAMSFAPVTGG